MLSQWVRRWSPRLLLPVNQLLATLRMTPDELTVAGLLMAIASGVWIAFDHLPLAAVFLILSGLLDSLDGALARYTGQSSRLGPFIDSVADHYGDFAVYFGLAWRSLATEDHLTVLLVMAAMFGSLVGSHVRSRAGMLGVDTRTVGIFTRMERTLVLLFALLSGLLVPSLALLALGNNLSALQRVIYTLKMGRRI